MPRFKFSLQLASNSLHKAKSSYASNSGYWSGDILGGVVVLLPLLLAATPTAPAIPPAAATPPPTTAKVVPDTTLVVVAAVVVAAVVVVVAAAADKGLGAVGAKPQNAKDLKPAFTSLDPADGLVELVHWTEPW